MPCSLSRWVALSPSSPGNVFEIARVCLFAVRNLRFFAKEARAIESLAKPWRLQTTQQAA